MSLDNMEFYIVAPEAGVNQICNPVPYQSLTGFTNYNGSQAIDPTYTRRGPACIKVSPSSGVASGVYYSPLSVVLGQPYTFSVDVKGVAGQAMRIYIANSANQAKATETFVATGNWQRISITWDSATETKSDYRVYVQRDAVASTSPFWIDGWQFEMKPYVTTFIYGYEKGLGYIDREYWWDGAPFASPSVRSAFTRHGGKLVRIKDYCKIISTEGLGEGTFGQIMTDMVLGGSTYQTHIPKKRPFHLLVQFSGDQSTMQANRKALISYLRPDVAGNQPMVLRYQGFDTNGNEVTQPVDIVCAPEASLTSIPQSPVAQREILSFTALEATLDGSYYEGSFLLYTQSLTVNRIVKRDPLGVWTNLNGGLPSGVAYAFAEAPNGDIYVGGSFGAISGVTGSARLARWSKSAQAWQAVLATPPNNDVFALKFDAGGNLYVGGKFTLCGGIANTKAIAKISGLPDAPVVSALGTGLSDPVGPEVRVIDIDPAGRVYVGGLFEGAGGITAYSLAYWDGAWHSLGMTQYSSISTVIANYRINSVAVGGVLRNLLGQPYLGVAVWNGSAWVAMGNNEISGDGTIVNDMVKVQGGLVIAGGVFKNFAGTGVDHYLAVYNGATWLPMYGGDVNAIVYDIEYKNYTTYVGGDFTQAGNLTLVDRVAKYSGLAWQSVGIDLPGVARVNKILYASDGSVYLGGNYTGTAYMGRVTVANVTSGGSADTYPIIQIKGPGTIQTIQNHTTGKHIDFVDLYVQPGEYINLWLDPHHLLFESSWAGRGSVLDYVAAGSNIADFNLVPGENNISVFMPFGTTANTNVWIRWQPKFWSLDGALL